MFKMRMAKAAKGAALAVALAAGIGADRAGADNLADAMIGAYNTSGLLEQNRALLRAADEDVAIALAALRPVVRWTGSVGRTQGRTELGVVNSTDQTSFFNTDQTSFFNRLSAQWLVFDGGASKLNKQAAQETVLATRQTLVAIEQQILFRAVSAYMSVLFQTENVALRINNVGLLQEELRASQDRFEVGEVTRTDVALAESRLAASRSSLEDARGLLLQAQAEYANAVGNKPGTLAGQPKLPARPASLSEAEAVALRTHPQILSAQHQVSAAELGIMAARSAFGPSATLNGNVDLTEFSGGNNRSTGSGVSLDFSQTIYQGGALSAVYRRASATRDAVRANLLTVQRDVAQGVADAFSRFDVARANLSATAERVRAAQVAFDGIREEATLGARTTLDVLTAEQELLDAQTSRISARAEESVAAYQLLAAQGLLTAERLGLAVQIYDPTLYYNMVKDAPAYQSKRGQDLDRVLKALGKQ